MQQQEKAAGSLRPEDSSTYWARRRRNNEAARRCRERRRMEELLLELRAVELVRENQRLRAALCALYPLPAAATWSVTHPVCLGDAVSVQSGVITEVPYRPWAAPLPRTPCPQAPAPDTGFPGCRPLHPPAAPLVEVHRPRVILEPMSHGYISAPQPPAALGFQAAMSAPRTLSGLPHKLRLKRARLLSGGTGDPGCSDTGTAHGGAAVVMEAV